MMRLSSAPPQQNTLRVGFAIVGALLIFAVFPRGIIPLNDCFGYIRSILLTFQHGRPWTDDWLEPWSAGFSVLGSLMLLLTRSMYLATYGTSALLAGVSVWMVSQLLVDRQIRPLLASLIALLILFFPTIQWKFVEVNCFSLYFVSLLCVIYFSSRGNWWGFLFFWCLALSNRQTAVAWGAIPAWAFMAALRKRSPIKSGGKPALVIGLAAAWFFFLREFMNQTHSQTVITDHLFDHWSIGAMPRPALIGLAVALAGMGLGRIALGHCPTSRTHRTRWIITIALVLTLLVLLINTDVRDYIYFDDDIFDVRISRAYVGALVILAGIGLASLRRVFSPALIAGALATVLIVSIRGATCDYYLVDAFCLAFFANGSAPSSASRRLSTRLAAAAVLCSLCFLVHFKMKYDRAYAIGTLSHQALKQGTLLGEEASILPFGLMGWFHFPHYAAHDGKNSTDIAGFGNKLKQDTVDAAVRYPWPLRRLQPFLTELPRDKTTLIAAGRFHFLWFTYADYELHKTPPARVRPAQFPFPPNFLLPPFPADDEGWWKLATSNR